MKQFGKKLLVFVIGNLIVDGIIYAATNLMEGKDILGNKQETVKTKVDMKGRVHLGTDDYQID